MCSATPKAARTGAGSPPATRGRLLVTSAVCAALPVMVGRSMVRRAYGRLRRDADAAGFQPDEPTGVSTSRDPGPSDAVHDGGMDSRLAGRGLDRRGDLADQ